MKKYYFKSILFILFFPVLSYSQTQFWSDTFEDTGAPSSGARSSSIEYGVLTAPYVGYFKRTDGTDISLNLSLPYTSGEGTKYWAAEDIDRDVTGTQNAQSDVQTITWNNINISGKNGLSFSGLFAAWNGNPVSDGNSIWEGTGHPAGADYMEVEYSIDGGSYTKIIGVYCHTIGNTSGILKLDTNGDLIGDAFSLSRSFQNFSATISGTGNLLSLRFKARTASLVEEMAIDNFRLFETPACPSVSATTSQTNVSCNGGINGSATVVASGGTSFTYAWSPSGGSAATASSLYAGNYTCTITNQCGNSTTRNFTITQPTALSVTALSQTNISCNGGSNGAASVNAATGGAGGYTYNWTPGNPTGDGTTAVTGLTTGTWTCTVTDANSCTAMQTFNITQPTALVLTPASQTNISCNGGSNGAASVNAATGGAGGYTYNWIPGNPTGDGTTAVTGLTAGTWTCTVTDANSCTSSTTFNVTQPTALALTPASQTNISCNGGSNGAASINTPTGGSGSYTYNWTPGNPTGNGTTAVTGLTTGTWTCTVTDANSCTTMQTFNITQPTTLALTSASQTNISCNGGSNGTASVNAATGGAGGYTYNWTPGNPTGDGTTSVTGLTAQVYTCTVTDANGCSAFQTFNITQPATALATATAVTNVACFGNSTGTATVTATGGTSAYTYLWSTGATTSVIASQTSGVKTVTVTDANGCTSIKSVSISQPAVALATATAVTNVACFGNSTGAATVTASGGTSAYTYLWSTGATTSVIASQTFGVKTVTVTDANGCNSVKSVSISQPASALATATAVSNVDCFGNSTGSATVTANSGTSAYTYLWSTGATTSVIASQSSGTKSYTVTDANGCTTSGNAIISQPVSALATSTTISNVLCNGGSTGSAAVTATGGTSAYSYLWSTGATTSVIASQTSGVKTVTVTDANGCTSVNSVNISQPTLLAATSSQTNTTCNGVCNGEANVSVSGGTSPYTYFWSNASTTASQTGLCAGSYSVTITDANGCTLIQTITITEPTAITITATSGNILCNGGSTTVTVTANGGTGAFTGTGTFTQTAGTYTYIVSDANACSTSTVIAISEPSVLTVNLSAAPIACNGSTTQVNIVATGGTAPYTGKAPVIVSAGSYSYTVTDNNGCVVTETISISEPSAIVASQTITLCNGQSLSIGANTYTASGIYVDVLQSQVNGCDSTLTTDLTISPAITHTQNINLCFGETINVGANTYNASGTYVDVLTAINGCDSTLTSILVVNPVIDVTTNLSGLTISANESSATYYQWIDCDNSNQPIAGETNQSFTASSNGNYAVIVTQNSCSDTSACVNISTVGIMNMSELSSINIYPNPSNGIFTINGLTNSSIINVYNTLGQSVYNVTIDKNIIELNLLDLSNGVYTITINSGNLKSTKRLTINK